MFFSKYKDRYNFFCKTNSVIIQTDKKSDIGKLEPRIVADQ